MGDIPDDVPSLDELGDTDDLPEYWTESTTITVDRWVKESLDRYREGRPWNQFLEQLRREHADPITFNDVDEIAEQLKNELSMLNEPVVSADVEGLVAKVERLESAAETIEERTGRMERDLETITGGNQ